MDKEESSFFFGCSQWDTELLLGRERREREERARLATEFDIVVIWYLSSGVRYTKSIPSDTKLGTDSLLSKSFFVPQGAGFSFMDILNGKIKNQLDNMC